MKRMDTSLGLGMKDNSESALSTTGTISNATRIHGEFDPAQDDAGGMLNTCKSDGKWCFQWRTGE
ncbi:hypothetical protein KFK09_001850 [Dendrobium nobile]|uniref:Uncharacterized protein n=1 Tax=Dendrobium nobile TaxID=94219 RepID=A0A8T3C6B0_DENNO|nr:hypothetical protein KFK09_001850 [Dendrobium nobile]